MQLIDRNPHRNSFFALRYIGIVFSRYTDYVSVSFCIFNRKLQEDTMVELPAAVPEHAPIVEVDSSPEKIKQARVHQVRPG